MSLTEELILKRSKARSLEAVRNLNCWGCGLSDISILAKIPNLEVLNIRWVWCHTQFGCSKILCCFPSFQCFSCNNLASLKDLRSCKYYRSMWNYSYYIMWCFLCKNYVYMYMYIGHKLTELYIRRNQLSDFSELDHLTSLPNLTVSI
jgi:Leucine-rich repeat (LRR) protein